MTRTQDLAPLLDYLDEVREMRREGFSWQAIRARLRDLTGRDYTAETIEEAAA